MLNFKDLDLLPVIQDALVKKGYSVPTPIQAGSIPAILEGKDLLGIAQTGTGKTAAFSLPLINRLGRNKIKARPARTRALILTPTRELATQIAENIQGYSKGMALKVLTIFGGVGQNPQVRQMARGVDVLVATPGRLLDLMGQGHIFYDQLEYFVLDEADRMLDMGFINDVKKVVKKLPAKRQTLFFSATMPDTIAELANSLLIEPVRVEVTPQATTVEKITQSLLFVEKTNKPHLLKSILLKKSAKQVLVFTHTKHRADRVVRFLEKCGISAAAIHGNKSQGARERALNGFRKGTVKVLVATDIAARGIDVPGISHVINFDLPNDSESYVHRIGRTARAGKDGIAISFCDEEEGSKLRAIEKLIKEKIPVDTAHEYHGAEAHACRNNPAPPKKQFQRGQRSGQQGKGKSVSNNQRKRRPARGSRRSGPGASV